MIAEGQSRLRKINYLLRKEMRKSCSLLLLLSCVGFLGRGGSNYSDGGLLVLGDGESLALGGELVEHVAGLTAGETIGVVSHVATRLGHGALVFETADLAGGLNGVVVEDGHGLSLLMLVLYLLGLGVDLLLSLSLATIKGNESINAALGLKAGLLKGLSVLESGSVEHQSVNRVVDVVLDLGSKQNYTLIKDICSQL